MRSIRGHIWLTFQVVLLATLGSLSFATAFAQQESPATAEATAALSGTKFEEADESNSPSSADLITAGSYPFSTLAGVPLEDMSSGTTQLLGANLDDNASAVTSLGFDFWFDGVRMTQFSCNVNGLCRLGPAAVTTAFTNALASATGSPKIAPFWDDLCSGANGKVHYKVLGGPGSRKLVVEWLNMKITRNGSCTAPVAGSGTFQMWLFETSGVVQFVYPAIAATTADGGYSIGFQSGAATNFVSVTTIDNSVSYTTANDTQMNAIAAGTSYLFSPAIPPPPTGLTFAAVSAVSLTINWTDNASNEVGYAIYRSTDGQTYTFLAQTAANATSFTDAPLSPTTEYFYRIFAITEGGVSAGITGSQITNPLGSVTSIAGSGNWSSPATWLGGIIPTPSDQVTIADNATITIDTAASAYSVTVGESGAIAKNENFLGAAAILQFESGTARTLTVGNDILIRSTGIFRSSTTGTVTTHSVSIAGDLINNGTLDFSTNGDTAGAGIIFTSADDAMFGGSGPTTDIRTLTVSKGTSPDAVVDLTTTSFTVQGGTADSASAGYLTLANGTFKLSGNFTASLRTFPTAAYTIPATAGLWVNNPNYTVTAQNGSPTVNGLFRMSQGTYNIGTASGNSMGFAANSSIVIEGGSINVAGRFGVTAAGTEFSYAQSGGTVTVQTAGNTSTTLAGFDMGTSTAASVTITGGNIVVQNANASATPRDYRHQAGSTTTTNGSSSVTGGTLQLGNTATAAVQAFNIQGVVPNLLLTNWGGNHTATWGAVSNWNHIARNITISAGTTMNFGNQLFLMNGPTLTNNGTMIHNGALSRFIWFLANTVQTYTGSGTVTAPMTSFEVQNGNTVIDSGATQIVANRFISFAGNLINANKLTLGSGGTSTATIQFGNTSAGAATNAGSFDSAPTFNPGTGGVVISYLRATTSRTTGFEIPPSRTLQNMTYDDNDLTHNLTIAGGNLTVAGTMTLANGVVRTGSNMLTHNGTVARTNGFVNGTLNRSYTAAGSYTYHVGVAGYSPVVANVTTLTTNPSSLSVKPTDDFLPGLVQETAVSRFWTLNEAGNITADLTFTYLSTDVNGNESSYKVWRRSGNVNTEVTPSTINETNNTASVSGITTFSDWGIGAANLVAASIGGRVTSGSGRGIALARVVLSDSSGVVQSALTNGFGYFVFQNVPTGPTYTVTVAKKGFTFSPPSEVIILSNNVTGVNFTGTAETP